MSDLEDLGTSCPIFLHDGTSGPIILCDEDQETSGFDLIKELQVLVYIHHNKREVQ